MLSKAVVKYIKSLQIKKYRYQHQAFVVEGGKSVLELLRSDFGLEHLFITEPFYREHTSSFPKGLAFDVVTEEELVKAGTFSSNNAALAVAKMRQLPTLEVKPSDLVIALDDVRDPGNLGTIIRIADWYGIQTVVCSETCADFYNAKVISATMGSFTRVQVHYLDLSAWLQQHTKDTKIYGASLAGENLHQMQLKPEGIVVLGNEANGIRPEVAAQVNQLIKIPAFGQAESLNVATATAIIMDNFRRNS
ncbi:TrmH family RNA methyltransferase [Pontibacter ummariensis]|uniref:RNA methyltransferase, TrmH family n=1 Tax=Pontibacter ummariensis TaxID=1610492 RepID=A0A239BV60_9BACT|nr:RNA methyltransferase [Pontibacter ummariensis]PRY15642.1 TrmH family RNA methyltransferase [Pontibacter ummariensis]SNS10934.1 RNA methyltransferase, TrmH family [Pontibacter ummariensis]